MKPARFAYHQAHSVDEAVSLLGEFGSDAKILAGGQSLVPSMNFRLSRPAVLIDINHAIELDFISEGDDGTQIGSLVRHVTLERGASKNPVSRLLELAAHHVGHLPIRVRGTFGGSLAHADPAAEWCVIATLLDAEIAARSASGSRTIPASEFFQTVFTTALSPDELLTEVRLPAVSPSALVGFSEFSRRAGDFALTMVAVVLETTDGRVESARIACGGVSDRPVRAPGAERALVGQQLGPDLMRAAAETASQELDPIGDIHGSADYRRDLIRVMTRRALEQATET
jgi:carbon-monoxide dehydrogenase medium subunit